MGLGPMVATMKWKEKEERKKVKVALEEFEVPVTTIYQSPPRESHRVHQRSPRVEMIPKWEKWLFIFILFIIFIPFFRKWILQWSWRLKSNEECVMKYQSQQFTSHHLESPTVYSRGVPESRCFKRGHNRISIFILFILFIQFFRKLI